MIDGAVERAQAAPQTEYYFAVALPHDELIGFVQLCRDGIQTAKLGYAIRRDQWGHGYATDATRTMLDFGFRKLGPGQRRVDRHRPPHRHAARGAHSRPRLHQRRLARLAPVLGPRRRAVAWSQRRQSSPRKLVLPNRPVLNQGGAHARRGGPHQTSDRWSVAPPGVRRYRMLQAIRAAIEACPLEDQEPIGPTAAEAPSGVRTRW